MLPRIEQLSNGQPLSLPPLSSYPAATQERRCPRCCASIPGPQIAGALILSAAESLYEHEKLVSETQSGSCCPGDYNTDVHNPAGDITSRLSADTTTVSDQICLNLNVGMRSATQAAVVMVFMVRASWRLTIVTLVMVPLIILVCKWYGTFYR